MQKSEDRLIDIKCVGFGQDLKCPVCDKIFIATDEWVYKRNKRKLCSYKCTVEYDRRIDANKKPGKFKTRNKSICDDFESGVTVRELADRHGLKICTIENIISNILFNGSVKALHDAQKI